MIIDTNTIIKQTVVAPAQQWMRELSLLALLWHNGQWTHCLCVPVAVVRATNYVKEGKISAPVASLPTPPIIPRLTRHGNPSVGIGEVLGRQDGGRQPWQMLTRSPGLMSRETFPSTTLPYKLEMGTSAFTGVEAPTWHPTEVSQRIGNCKACKVTKAGICCAAYSLYNLEEKGVWRCQK